jgi:F-type H+-transporting ATPase subunit b
MRPHRRIAALAAAGSLSASPVLAGGMPQLDFANPLTISQVVWGAIIFIVLYIILSRFALPKVAEVLETRASLIAGHLEAARVSKEQADSGMTEAAAAIAKARAEAQAAVNQALDEAKSAAAAQADMLNQQLDVRLRSAEAQINAARTQAMGALRQVASDTAAEVVSRLTGARPDSARVENTVGAVMAQRGV